MTERDWEDRPSVPQETPEGAFFEQDQEEIAEAGAQELVSESISDINNSGNDGQEDSAVQKEAESPTERSVKDSGNEPSVEAAPFEQSAAAVGRQGTDYQHNGGYQAPYGQGQYGQPYQSGYPNGYQYPYTQQPQQQYGYRQAPYQTQNAVGQGVPANAYPYQQRSQAGYVPPAPPVPPYSSNGTPQGDPDQGPEKKKMKKQTKVFLWIVGILLVALGIGFCIYGILLSTGTINQGAGGGNSSSASSLPNRGDDQAQLEVEEIPSEGMMTPKQVYEKVRKSVVAVVTYSSGSDLTDSPMMSGSGVVFSKDGYIVTNSHVVGDTNAYPVKVVINGETEDQSKEYSATVIGFDKRTDIAVLKIDANDLTPAEFANSDELQVGDTVLSLGNPGVGGENFTNTLTKGMVSAVNRTVSMSNLSMKYIQTDAAINPGSSGGALLNLYGQVVGINAAKITTTDVEGICFAIPTNIAKDVINDLIAQGYVTGRVRVGVTIRAISSYEAQLYNVPQGLVIASFSADSNLPAQGVQEGDIITKIDGVDATSYNAFYNELEKHNPGDTIKLTIYRQATNSQKSKTFEVEIKLLEDKGETQQPQNNDQQSNP